MQGKSDCQLAVSTIPLLVALAALPGLPVGVLLCVELQDRIIGARSDRADVDRGAGFDNESGIGGL